MAKLEKASHVYGETKLALNFKEQLNHFPYKFIAKRINITQEEVASFKQATADAKTALQACIE